MNSPVPYSSSLPIEIIQLILSFLPKHDLLHLLTNPPNYSWLYATASIIYRQLSFVRQQKLAACYMLFTETRQRRQNIGLKESHQKGFYSTVNYSAFVRDLDLSRLGDKEGLRPYVLVGLTIDSQHLCNLNLYNCHTITTESMITVFLHCPQLERLSLAGATGIDVSCFLDSRVLPSCCQQLRELNLDLLPLFFNPSPTILNKYRRHFGKKDGNQIPKFPRLQKLKLGKVYQPKRNFEVNAFLFTLMIRRCANVDFLQMDSMSPNYIAICLQYCQHIRSITFQRCYLYKGMFTSLIQQHKQHEQHHHLRRLEMEHCFTTTSGIKKANVDMVMNEITAMDYHRLEWLGLKKMTIPNDLLDSMLTQINGFYLTKFDCPDSMTDDALVTLMTRCPSLTHFSICMFWNLDNNHDYHYDKQQNKRTVLTLSTLMQALTTWKETLEWLEIHEGRKGMNMYQRCEQRHVQYIDIDDDDQNRRRSRKAQHSIKEQQTFIDYLCHWKGGDKMQVLILSGMALPLSIHGLERLARCFPNTRYLVFLAKRTARIYNDLEITMAAWKKLDGFLCVNRYALGTKTVSCWYDWRWAMEKEEQFRRWDLYDLNS
ncbi:hypothetical protein BCR42DRAFT_407826 [Absidia repens]|uniref:F-box domain-containing protein n=1 Tax=Absidia repens TaxID=90262 RepID=A0A1X2ISQ5_9FUNG|nr:hypothetical protein BCR42DRAFT_407826 [Absidia repens]